MGPFTAEGNPPTQESDHPPKTPPSTPPLPTPKVNLKDLKLTYPPLRKEDLRP